MTDIWIVFAIIAGVIGLFMWDRLPVIAVCVGCALALWATGVLSINQALISIFPRLFSYQIFVRAKALPTVPHLLSETISSSEELRKATLAVAE